MMQVKGGGIQEIPAFIKEKHGEEIYQKWLNSLSPEGQKIFKGQILPSLWYPLKNCYADAEQKLCDLVYGGDPKKIQELGEYMADKSLSGIYSIFVKVGSPLFVISKATSIFGTFYTQGKLVPVSKSKKSFVFHVVEFPEITEVIENQIAGWAKQAVAKSGGKNSTVSVNKSFAKGDEVTEIELRWE